MYEVGCFVVSPRQWPGRIDASGRYNDFFDLAFLESRPLVLIEHRISSCTAFIDSLMLGCAKGTCMKHVNLWAIRGKSSSTSLPRHFLHSRKQNVVPTATMDLEDQALKQFDKLVAAGELQWQENEVRVVEAEPFNARNISAYNSAAYGSRC